MDPIRFGIQSYRQPARELSSQRLLNGYAEIHPRTVSAKAPISVHGLPGLASFATVGNGPIRGFYEQDGVLYVVSRNELYSVASDGTATLRGTGISGINLVSMDSNGTEIAIVNGSEGFIYDTSTNAFTEISDANFNAAATVTSIDSYFVLDWMGTNKFFVSNVLDGLSYDALDFATAESKPDRLKAVRNISGVLRLLGEKTIESWDSIGAGTPPFQRFDGATITTHGLLASQAIAETDEAAFILGSDRIFYRLSGTALRRISTHAIEKEWETYTTTSDAFCIVVPFGGHKFVYVTFPTEGKTWGYDLSTRLWHERISWDRTGTEVRWRANCAIEVFNKVLIGDANSGQIGELSPSTHTEFGDPVRCVMVTPPIFDPGGGRVFNSMLEIDVQNGVGIATGQGSDPQIMLDYSDDGGNTWSAPELWRGMGKIGQYEVRLQWDRLGSFYQRIYRLQISDPVMRTVMAARANLRVGEA